MKIILFQGDSITDAARSRTEDEFNLGLGYPAFVKGTIGNDYPGEYNFFNRGVGGNTIVDLYSRIKKDIINLKPDIMSILIGVNDAWRRFDSDNGVDNEKFFKIYSMLIEEIKEALPDTKIMILEPFILKTGITEENYDEFRKEVEGKAQKAKLVAEKYGLIFVELQKYFDELGKILPASEILTDGVHPTSIGHEIIKREWMKAFKKTV